MRSPDAIGAAIENTVDDIAIATTPTMRAVTMVVNIIFLNNNVLISRCDMI